MREILLTGNTAPITNEFCQKLSDYGKIVVCGDTQVTFTEKPVMLYPYHDDDMEFKGIFDSYNFETAVYFSRVIDGGKKLKDGIELLENLLYYCRMNKVRRIFYVTTNDYNREGKDMTTRTRLLKNCEDLCREFAEETGFDVTLLRVPYLFSQEDTGRQLHRMLHEAMEKNGITMQGGSNEVTDFLADTDLGELIARLADEPMKGFHIFDIPGGNRSTFNELADSVKAFYNDVKIEYKDYAEAVPGAGTNEILRKQYGWYPMEVLKDDIPDMIKNIKERNQELKKQKKKKGSRAEKWEHFLLVALETAALFLCSEWLIHLTRGYTKTSYLDFRLLFVVIMGTVHGIRAGMAASILASIAYLFSSTGTQNLQIIFYNIENWLPFAAYFLVGVIVGHNRDKKNDAIRFGKKQQEILERKYGFLSELYSKTLENKEEFSRQIIGYKDSYGIIYKVVQKLNSTMPQEIFYEAVSQMEEVLEVSSVAIYTIGAHNQYARLNVCSKEIYASLSKSINLEDYSDLLESLQEKRTYINTAGREGNPAYAAPIVRDGIITGMIALWRVTSKQMNMDFSNKFNILCGLTGEALMRAIAYTERVEQETMIAGTRIMKPENFEEILKMEEQLRRGNMSAYMLLQIETDGKAQSDAANIIMANIRNGDVIGQGQDGNLYLLLKQGSRQGAAKIEKRLNPYGIALKQSVSR